MEDEWDPDIGFFYPDMWGTDELIIDRDHSTYHRTAHSFVWILRSRQRYGRIHLHTLARTSLHEN
jgi:hypothetical protein